MNKKIVSVAFASVLLLSVMIRIQFNMLVAASYDFIRVPKDYPTIQAAVDAASSGDTIQVAAGIYYEHVTVDKSLTLLGEDSTTTIIDGGWAGTVVTVTADNVNISGFTI